MRYFLLLILIASSIHSFPYKKSRDGIILKNENGIILNPLSGGLNNPEHQFVDIDEDGDFDLFILNSDGGYSFWENIGTSVEYNFLEKDFPPGLSFVNWFYFCDINNDSKPDCFTGADGNYIKLFINSGSPSMPEFTLAADTVFESSGDALFSESVSNPAFIDIDGDFDYDFFVTDQSGKVRYFENRGDPINYDFTFVTDSWQDILIVGSGKSEKHGAASIEFCDPDGDGDFDLIWGDFFSRSLYFIKNDGDISSPDMKLETDIYPSANPLNTSGFNMPRSVDIDADGDLDLFVSVLYDPTVPQSLIFMKNKGNPAEPIYKFVTDRFLEIFDVGTKSTLCFVDMDNDGDADLLIGSEKNPEGSIYYLENVGASDTPEFILRDSLYTGYTNDLSIAPFATDIDNDGDNDIIAGTFLGQLVIIKNNGTPEVASFSGPENLLDVNGENIKFSNYARPVLADMDNDNDDDLIIGGFNGKLIYYKNTGTPENYLFEIDNSVFGDFDIGDMSNPEITDYNLDGNFDIVAGNRNGELFLVAGETNSGTPSFLAPEKIEITEFEGKEAAPRFYDLDSDGDQDLILGNIKGGLSYYKDQRIISGIDISDVENDLNYQIDVYPNPFNGGVNIILPGGAKTQKIFIYNIAGEIIFAGNIEKNSKKFYWQPELNINSGVYFLAAKSSDNILLTKKIVYLK